MQHIDTPTEQLHHYLAGMKRHARSSLEQLGAVDHWHDLARRELERRATILIEAFNVELLTAIVAGDVNVNAVIRDVLAAE